MATTRQARSWARQHYNFMTPEILTIRKIKSLGNVWVEFSCGDFMDKPMWGISIIEYNIKKGKFEMSDKFSQFRQAKHNEQEAEKYFNDVVEMLELIGKATIWK